MIFYSAIVDPDGGQHANLIEVNDPTLACFHEVKHAASQRTWQKEVFEERGEIDEGRKTPSPGRCYCVLTGQKEERNGK